MEIYSTFKKVTAPSILFIFSVGEVVLFPAFKLAYLVELLLAGYLLIKLKTYRIAAATSRNFSSESSK